MKNVFELPSNELIDQKILEQEAVEWLVKLDADTPLAIDELEALKKWMARSPAHTKEINSLNEFTGKLLVLTELNIPLVKPMPKVPITKRVLYSSKAWTMAACIVGLALLMRMVFLPGTLSSDEPFDSTNGYYASAIGKSTSIPLQDGSVVVLNTNSQIKVEFTEQHRNIHLIQGEAHFEVAKNKDIPFRVFAGKGRVKAVGTAFTVYLREQDVDVLVTEGKVELAALNVVPKTAATRSDISPPNLSGSTSRVLYVALPVEQLGLLEAGEGVTIHMPPKNVDKSEPSSPQVKTMGKKQRKRRDTWRHGFVLFTGDTLEDVIAEVGRYSPVAIEIVEPELKNLRIGGQFRVGDLESLFETLEFSFGLEIKLLDNQRVEITAAHAEKNHN